DLKEWFSLPTLSAGQNRSLQDLMAAHERRPRSFRIKKWYAVAAAALLVALVGSAYVAHRDEKPMPLAFQATHDIGPGGNKAVLVVGDGRPIELRANQSRITNSNGTILYGDGSEVPRAATDRTRPDMATETVSLTLRTP